MRLEVGTFDVRQITFGSHTILQEDTLVVNREAVRAVVLQDPRLADVEVVAAHPGEPVRIVHIMDVVEPRCKLDGPAGIFPGLVGPPRITGSGATHRLRGIAVVEAGDPVPGEPSWWREAIVDMSGPAAALSPFGQTVNLVLHVRPREGIGYQDYNLATRLAGLRVAEHLASITRFLTPPAAETYELFPIDTDLPRIVFIYQLYTPYLYGHVDSELLATLLHPNELFDGAVVNSRNGPACTRPVTYLDQNNAVVSELYRGHGVDWEFAGVVAFSGHDASLFSKERGAAQAAKLARLLRAEGAILVYPSSGHPVVNIMLVCQECERMGIRTVLLMNEMAATPDDTGFVHSVPEAVAIVNTGNFEELVRLPAIDRVVGGSRVLESDQPAAEEIEVPVRQILSATSQSGYGRLRAIRY